MKKIVALTALALAATAGSAHAQNARVELRLLVQTITGTGAARSVTTQSINPSAGTPFVAAVGSTVRFTVQYQITDLTDGSDPITGLSGLTLSYDGTTGSGLNGTIARSFLTTAGSGGGSAEDASAQANPGNYPQTGTSASRSGTHRQYRGAITTDGVAANGVIDGVDINNNVLLSISNSNQNPGSWYGLYSWEFTGAAGSQGTVSYTVAPQGTAGDNIRYFRDSTPIPQGSVATGGASFAALPTAVVQFGSGNTAPVANVTNRVITADPFVNPDASNLSLATFSDGDVGNTIDVTITNDGGIGALGGVVSIVGDNTATPSIVLNWDAPNAAIGTTFNVAFSYTDGTETRTGVATVQVIPAPGAAALLGLGGLLAARRRRA